MSSQTPTRIVILGGGFGGLYAALELDKSLAREPGVQVTLVNRDNFFLFTPMLHEVAASDLDMATIVNPMRKMLRHVRLFIGDVESIDLQGKRVTVSHGEEKHEHELEYDHLVLGMGSVTSFHGLPGVAEGALTMKSLGDAIYLRNRMIAHLEQADFECCESLREGLLTFVVAGGGFAGVETAAGINDFLRQAVKFYANLREDMIRIVLVHSGSAILPELGEKLGRYAQRKLSERHVEFVLGGRVSALKDGQVHLTNGQTIRTDTLIWTAGTSPHPMTESLTCPKERGRVQVNEFLEVTDRPGVWALGDCAWVPDAKGGGCHPTTAQHALRQGRTLARNVAAAIRGGEKKPFRFSTLGQLAAIGRRTGVANIMGVNFSGFFAWWLWRTIYLSKVPRFEKKLRVVLDWTLDLIFSKDLVQFMTMRSGGVSARAVGASCGLENGHAKPMRAPELIGAA